MKPVILSCRVIFSGYHFQKHNKIKPCHFTELFSNVSLPFQLEKKKTIRKQKKIAHGDRQNSPVYIDSSARYAQSTALEGCKNRHKSATCNQDSKAYTSSTGNL
jgi:hypothetical protein